MHIQDLFLGFVCGIIDLYVCLHDSYHTILSPAASLCWTCQDFGTCKIVADSLDILGEVGTPGAWIFTYSFYLSKAGNGENPCRLLALPINSFQAARLCHTLSELQD